MNLQYILHLESFAWCRVTWKDSGCDSKRGISAAYNVLVVDSYNPDIVLGPPCTSCEQTARVDQELFRIFDNKKKNKRVKLVDAIISV